MFSSSIEARNNPRGGGNVPLELQQNSEWLFSFVCRGFERLGDRDAQTDD
jgi:hypothetical protein